MIETTKNKTVLKPKTFHKIKLDLSANFAKHYQSNWLNQINLLGQKIPTNLYQYLKMDTDRRYV